MRLFAFAFLFVLSLSRAFAGETPLPINDAFRFTVARGPADVVQLHWRMPSGYYLYRQYLSAKTVDGRAVELKTAPGIEKSDPNFGTSAVYFGTADAEFDSSDSAVTVTYQGCQDHGLCYPPARRTVDLKTLAVSEEPIFSLPSAKEQSAWSPETENLTPSDDVSQRGEEVASSPHEPDIVDDFLSRGGVPLLLAAFVGFGILIAFTPCVFPLYPILAATLTREGDRLDTRRGLLLSASYAIGLATAFGIFGAAAAWTGENLQLVLQSPFTVGLISAVFVVLALSMFGLFELQLPSALMTRLSRRTNGSGGSPGSAAILGFTSAFIVGPCVTAPLAAALLYVARTGDALLGGALLFALGLGKGVPLVIFGALGSRALPRAGAWMESIKHVFGFVFLAFGIWMAEAVLPVWLPIILWAALCMTVAVFLGAFDVVKGRSHPFRMGSQAAGLIMAVYAVILLVAAAAGSSDPARPLAGLNIASRSEGRGNILGEMALIGSSDELKDHLQAAQAAGKPSLIYFTADWCVSCRTIDRAVLTKADVVDTLAPLQAFKVDLTTISQSQRDLMRRLNVVGPPTMIFFGPDQKESRGGRLIGEFNEADVLKAAGAARAKT